MKNIHLRTFLLVLAFSSAPLWAGEPLLLSGIVTEQEAAAPLPLHSDLYGDFRSHLEAAIERQDLIAIQALYQTNGIGAEEFKTELARWRRVFGECATQRFVYFKELSTLPPQAHDYWATQARHLTEHKATHLAFVGSGTEGRLILPLVVVEDRLLIVPSEKRKTESCCQANGSDPIRSKTNRTPRVATPADKK